MLEATVICVDNSENARNGDFIPNRLDAQRDASNLICGAKTGSNPENAVGLLAMAGDRVGVVVSPTVDMGQILQGLHEIGVGGAAPDLVKSLKIAQLALKHRSNKNQRQRIVLFVGSPVDAPAKLLEQVGKTLRKNNVAVDVILFGRPEEIERNREKLSRLHAAVSSNDNSRLVECSSDVNTLLSDLVISSPLLRDPGADPPPPADAAAAGTDLATVDAAADPELYMALQMSLQEERERQAAAAAAAAAAAGGGGEAASAAAAAGAAAAGAAAAGGDGAAAAAPEGESAASASGAGAPPAVAPPASSDTNRVPTIAEIENLAGVDDELRQALLFSLQDFQAADGPAATATSPAPGDSMGSSLMSSMVLPEGCTMGEVPMDPAASSSGSLAPQAEVSDARLAEAIAGGAAGGGGAAGTASGGGGPPGAPGASSAPGAPGAAAGGGDGANDDAEDDPGDDAGATRRRHPSSALPQRPPE